MNWYINVIAALALIAVGWFYRGEHDAKELQHVIQENQESHARLAETQTRQRAALETELAQARKVADARIRSLTKENVRLQEYLDSAVPTDLLVYLRVCESPAECSLFLQQGTNKGTPPEQRPIQVTLHLVYRVLRTYDELIERDNLRKQQLLIQLEACNN